MSQANAEDQLLERGFRFKNQRFPEDNFESYTKL